MSVYITGMEIPPSCRYCEFRHMSITQNAFCTAAHETIDYMAERTKRLDNCPLVPVQPHGDLIGRNWLIDIALHLMNTAKNDDIYNGVKWLLQYIVDAPTVIKAEEGER